MRIQFSSIWSIDRTLSSATTSGQNGVGSDGNEGCLRSSKLQHYFNLTIKVFSVICRTLVEWGGILPHWRDAVGVFCAPSWLGHLWYQVFAKNKKIIFKQIYLSHRRNTKQVLPLQVRVDLGVMAIKTDSTLPSFPDQELHHQMQLNVIQILLVSYLFGFYGISTLAGYLMSNSFLYK